MPDYIALGKQIEAQADKSKLPDIGEILEATPEDIQVKWREESETSGEWRFREGDQPPQILLKNRQCACGGEECSGQALAVFSFPV